MSEFTLERSRTKFRMTNSVFVIRFAIFINTCFDQNQWNWAERLLLHVINTSTSRFAIQAGILTSFFYMEEQIFPQFSFTFLQWVFTPGNTDFSRVHGSLSVGCSDIQGAALWYFHCLDSCSEIFNIKILQIKQCCNHLPFSLAAQSIALPFCV